MDLRRRATGHARPGSQNGKAKLSLMDVARIRRLHREGRSVAAIAAEYEISARHVQRIAAKSAWKTKE